MSALETIGDSKRGMRRRRRSGVNISKPEPRPTLKDVFNHERREEIAFYGLLSALILMPFFYGGNRDWVWGSFLALTCAVSALTIWSVPIAERLASVGIHRRRPWFVVLLLLWLLLQLVHCVSWNGTSFSSDRAASIRALLKTSLYLQLIFQTLILAQTHRRLKRLFNFLFVAAVLHAVFASIAKLWGVRFVSEFFVFGMGGGSSFLNENSFAGYLELHLAIGAGLLVAGLRFHGAGTQTWRQIARDWVSLLLARKTQVRICMVLLVIALVLTGSRMGNVAFFVALLGTGTLAYFFMLMRPPALGALLISLVLIDLVVVGSWFGADQIAARLASTRIELGNEQAPVLPKISALGAESSLALTKPAEPFELDRERPGLTRVAIKLFAQAPLLGHGAGSFRTIFPPVRSLDLSHKFYDHAHNDYAQILAEYGLLGAGIILALLILILSCAFTALRQRSDKLSVGAAFTGLFGISALLLHAIADFNFQMPGNAAIFSVVFTICWISRYGLRDTGKAGVASGTTEAQVL
jgi:putative inorganic carbon (HCO3(-)) transporter